MSRQRLQAEVVNHVRGLITEAGRLTFPEDASVYEINFVLHPSGVRQRRLGMRGVGEVITPPAQE